MPSKSVLKKINPWSKKENATPSNQPVENEFVTFQPPFPSKIPSSFDEVPSGRLHYDGDEKAPFVAKHESPDLAPPSYISQLGVPAIVNQFDDVTGESSTQQPLPFRPSVQGYFPLTPVFQQMSDSQGQQQLIRTRTPSFSRRESAFAIRHSNPYTSESIFQDMPPSQNQTSTMNSTSAPYNTLGFAPVQSFTPPPVVPPFEPIAPTQRRYSVSNMSSTPDNASDSERRQFRLSTPPQPPKSPIIPQQKSVRLLGRTLTRLGKPTAARARDSSW